MGTRRSLEASPYVLAKAKRVDPDERRWRDDKVSAQDVYEGMKSEEAESLAMAKQRRDHLLPEEERIPF